MNKKRICVIDCGSNKTKDIITIAEKTGAIIDRWYLFYPTIDNFKLQIDKKKFNKMTLLQNINEEVYSTNFDKNFCNNYDFIIFSGGGIIEGIQEDIIQFFSFLKHNIIPVYGICFGHQIIGLVFGANVFYMNKKVKGSEHTEFIDSNVLTKGLSNNNNFEKNHSEAITLPENFNLIASSKTCNVEMIQHNIKPIYGTQFHPEVSGKVGELLILNFLNNQ